MMKAPLIHSCFAAVAMLAVVVNVPAATTHVPRDHPTIQAAIDSFSGGVEIIVAPGVYNEAINFHGKAIHLRSSDGPEETILDGAGLRGSIVTFSSGEGRDTAIEGFTITGGDASSGGGINIVFSSPTVINCILEANNAIQGGGASVVFGSPKFKNCTFIINTATQGGAIRNSSASPTVKGCAFIWNSADLSGGAMANTASHPVITDCVFHNNNGGETGGALYNVGGSTLSVTDCSFVQNSALVGGAVFGELSTIEIADNNFCLNLPEHIAGTWDDLGGNTFCIVGDLDGDGDVDLTDLLLMLDEWGPCPAPVDGCPADLNGDGVVDCYDLLILLSNWS